MRAKGRRMGEIEGTDREVDGPPDPRGGTDPQATLERIQYRQDPYTTGPAGGPPTGNDTLP